MLSTTRSPIFVAGYSREILNDRPHFANAIYSATDPQTYSYALQVQHLAGISAMGVLTKVSYDIARTRADRILDERQNAAILGGIILFAVDVVDDEIDRKRMPVEEKIRYLDAWMKHVITGGNRLSETEYPAGCDPRAVTLSFDLSASIHQKVSDYDGIERMDDQLSPLAADVIKQLTSQDCDEQLKLTEKIGSGCGLISSVAVEIVTGDDLPQVARAAECLGAYAECLNHATEITEDLNEESLSYATLYLKKFGDTKPNRKFVRSQLLKLAREAWQEGLIGLDSRQSSIQRSAKILIDLKYKLLGRIAKP